GLVTVSRRWLYGDQGSDRLETITMTSHEQGMQSDLDRPAIASPAGSLSVRELLQWLHSHQRLTPLLAEAYRDKYLLDQARRMNLTISTEDLQKAANVFRRRHDLTAAEKTNAWLRQEHLTITDFETALEHDLILARFQEAVTRDRI